MPASASLFNLPIVPTCAQAALAIVILRSKPGDTTVREYVLQLREHYKSGRPAHNDEELDHYLDLVGYWQDQCRKAQEECDRLRSINVRLERSNQMLSQRTNTTPDDRPSTATSTSKRKAAASLTRSPKRSKAPSFKREEQSVAQTQEGIENDYEFLEGLGQDGSTLIEALYTSHRLCRTMTPDPEALCQHLVRTSSALANVIHLIANNHEHLSQRGRRMQEAPSLGEDRSDFSHALKISARAFMSVLVGITKMMDVSNDDRLPSLVVCGLADMFKTALLAVESSALHTANTNASEPPPLKKGKVKAPTNTAKESVPARSIAHFLIGLLGLLDKSNGIHQKIFDGFAFLLLERVGKRLYYCIFGRHRSTTIEGCLTPPPEPSKPSDKTKRDIEALGIRFEMKALVLILERAMGLAAHHMNPPSKRSGNNSIPNRLGRTLSMKTLPSAPKGRLSSIAKDRLQRTLVTCMYGDKVEDEFLDVLTKPVPSMRVGALQNVAKINDKDVDEWYKEEVWRLVGWDIMARESRW